MANIPIGKTSGVIDRPTSIAPATYTDHAEMGDRNRTWKGGMGGRRKEPPPHLWLLSLTCMIPMVIVIDGR
jgi:hypothetical protein